MKNLLIILLLIGVVAISGCTNIMQTNKFIGTWELKGSLLGEEVSIAKATFSEKTVVITDNFGMGSATYEIVNNTYLLMTDEKSGESNRWYYEFVDSNTVFFWGEGEEKMVWHKVA
jgi:hypothetical protein